MKKTNFKDDICRPFCMFFAEDEKEEMACLGARVAASLGQKGLIDTGRLIDLKKNRRAWEAHREVIGPRVCRVCEFREEDCDFQSPAPSDDLEPCGGYIALSWLIEAGLLHPEDLEKGI